MQRGGREGVGGGRGRQKMEGSEHCPKECVNESLDIQGALALSHSLLDFLFFKTFPWLKLSPLKSLP